MWGYIKQLTEMDAAARSVKFLLINELGYGAVQAMPADGSGNYPQAQRSSLQEPEAKYKEWSWTVQVPRVLEGKTGSELMQYAQPLATELDNKQIAFARLKCIELQGDGSGAIGRLTADPTATAGSTDNITFVVENTTGEAGRSNIRWFQEGDKVYFAASDGSVHDSSQGTSITGDTEVAYWKITDINEDTYTVTAQAYTAGDVLIQITATTINADDPSDNDYVYRGETSGGSPAVGTTAQDLDSISTNDYATLSEVMAGMETLAAADSRVIHGLTMEGSIKGSRKDLNGATLDNRHFQQHLSTLKRKAGKGRYTYDCAFMSDPTYDSLVDAREADRRFHSIEDSDRGVRGVGYVHGKDRVEFKPDEFVHDQRIWLIPKGKEALCYIGSEARQVKPNGNDPFHLGVNSTGYTRNTETFFEQTGVLISKHPRALGVIEDFTVTT
jgi:hypothetical protein